MFDPITPLPLHRIKSILVLIPELHRNLVALKSEEFFAEDVVFLFRPFLRKKLGYGLVAIEKVGAITPDRCWGVGSGDLLGVFCVPEVLGEFHLLMSGGLGEGWKGRSGWHCEG